MLQRSHNFLIEIQENLEPASQSNFLLEYQDLTRQDKQIWFNYTLAQCNNQIKTYKHDKQAKILLVRAIVKGFEDELVIHNERNFEQMVQYIWHMSDIIPKKQLKIYTTKLVEAGFPLRNRRKDLQLNCFDHLKYYLCCG